MRKMAWGQNVSLEFRQKVTSICADFGWSEDHADWLMACMAFETGRRFKSNTRSPVSSATGLIQFMEKTALSMGTTTQKMAVMTEVEQLDYVSLHFKPYAKRIKSLQDMYMAILCPKFIGKLPSTVMFNYGTREYSANNKLDKNKDGCISVQECLVFVKEQYDQGMTRTA